MTKLSKKLEESEITNAQLKNILESEEIFKSPSAISSWYCGHRTPGIKTLIVLSKLMHCEITSLAE